MNKCLNCNKEVYNKFCNTSCQNKFQNSSRAKRLLIKRYGELKNFDVNCFKCKKKFLIIEHNNKFNCNKKYYCSISCANSRIFTKESNLKRNESGRLSWTKERREKLSKAMSEHNTGGRCKWYEINGKKVQGTYELNFAKKLNEFEIKWERCKPHLYVQNGRNRHYTPDFYLPEFNWIIEIKGFLLESHIEKMNLAIIQNEDLKNLKIIKKNIYENLIKMENKKEFLNLIQIT
jgi:hypothetical protein